MVYLLLSTFKLFGIPILIISVPDEGYPRNVPCTLNSISMLLLNVSGPVGHDSEKEPSKEYSTNLDSNWFLSFGEVKSIR